MTISKSNAGKAKIVAAKPIVEARYLLDSYFHQDWRFEADSVHSMVHKYAEDIGKPEVISAAHAGIAQMLAGESGSKEAVNGRVARGSFGSAREVASQKPLLSEILGALELEKRQNG